MATVTKSAGSNDGNWVTTCSPAQNATITSFHYNFNFAIPDGSAIDKIQADVEFHVSTTASIATFGLYLYHGGVAVGTEATDTTEPLAAKLVSKSATPSAVMNRWGVWDVNKNTSSDWEVRIRATRGNDADAVTFTLDSLNVTVTYTEPPEAQTETETPPVDAVGTASLVSVQTDHLVDVVQASGIAELVEVIAPGGAAGTALLMTYVDITKAFLHDADVGYTDYTTQANEDTADDVPLLPASIGANDAFYYLAGWYGDTLVGCFYINVTTAGVGTYTLAWEYYNGSSWVSLDSYIMTFGSIINYKTSGINKIDIAKPSDIADVLINGVLAKWIRARYVSGTVTTQPLAGRIKVYEVGDYTEPSGTTYYVTISDSVTIIDNITKSINKYTGIADQVTIVDSLRKAITKIQADVSTIADSLFKTIGIYRFESIRVYDLFAKLSATFHVSLSDNISISDELRKIIPKYIVDNITMVDELRKTLYKHPDDQVAISDSLVHSWIRALMLSDSITITDLLQKTVKKRVSTPVALIDSLRKTVKKLLGDEVPITEEIEIDHIKGPPDLMYRKPTPAKEEETEEWHDVTSIQRKGPDGE